MKKYIDDYFAKQGIRVIYNTLGHTDELVQVYVKETYNTFFQSKATFTNSIKSSLYNKFYTLKARDKKTGFEKLEKKDTYFRNIIIPTNMSDMWNSPSHTFDILKNDGESYLDCLKKHLLKIEDPLLFYSGGIDSELVLQTFLDIGIKPIVVVFEFTDTLGNVLNQYDILYASEFCNKNDIKPIIKRICLESLWDTDEFIQIGKTLRIGSPQILTHIYMAKIMADEMPGMTYCFGGEIRYSKLENVQNPNKVLVSSTKSFGPLPWPSGTVTGSSNTGAGYRSMNVSTRYYTPFGNPYPEYRLINNNTVINPAWSGQVYGPYNLSDVAPSPLDYTFIFTWSLTSGSDPRGTNGSIDGTAKTAGSGVPYSAVFNGGSSPLWNFDFEVYSDSADSPGTSYTYAMTWRMYNNPDPSTYIEMSLSWNPSRT